MSGAPTSLHGGRCRIVNGRLILRDRILERGHVSMEGGRIIGLGPGDGDDGDFDTIDATGLYVSPGFIDLHVHGGGGHDFMDATEEAFRCIAATHARHGTTAMMPTTLTAERDDLYRTLEVYERLQGESIEGSCFIGMHLEGPYLAMSQRGAQDPRFIRDPDPGEYLPLLERFPCIRRWSAAPERKGAVEFGRALAERGILASMAHTDAVYEEALEAYRNGYTLLTHFYSAMSTVTRRNAFRYAGVVEAGYLHDGLDVEVIADGIHLPSPLLRLIFKVKGPDRTALVTDAMRAADMPEGDSHLGNSRNAFPVVVEDGVAKLPDRSAFAGSVATADRLVRNMVRMAGVGLTDAVAMISATPARIAGIGGRKGAIAPGMDADITLFDEDITVKRTLVGGRTVFAAP